MTFVNKIYMGEGKDVGGQLYPNTKEFYMGAGKDDYSAMQGPAPTGFHVPTAAEWQGLCSILTTTFGLASNGNTMKTYLKMPFAGHRYYSSAGVNLQGTYGYYWSAYAYNTNYAYYLRFDSSTLSPQLGSYRAYGFSLRCFKDIPVAPDDSWTQLYIDTPAWNTGIYHNSTLGLISIGYRTSGEQGMYTKYITIADKNLGATTVYNDGDTLSQANCGNYYQWGNNYGFAWTGNVTTSSTQVDASNYGPGNYYSSSTFITNSGDWSSAQNDNLWGGETGVQKVANVKQIYLGTELVWGELALINTPGIYHNTKKGLISLSSDGANWLTISDKNLGATTVYNDGDTLSEANCGKYYQWGNNYGFAWTGSITTSGTKVDTTTYGPGNYYNSSTFITGSGDWSSVQNDNLWGGTTGTNEAMQGPSPSGFHVPTKDENVALKNTMTTLGIDTSNGDCIKTYLKMPFAGYRGPSAAYITDQGEFACYWAAIVAYTDTAYVLSSSSSGFWPQDLNLRSYGFSIRCFKNASVQPDESRTVLYQPTAS